MAGLVIRLRRRLFGRGALSAPSGRGAVLAPSGHGALSAPSGRGAVLAPSGRGAVLAPSAAVLMVVACLVPAGVAQAGPRNLVRNPSVEISAGTRPAGWSPIASGTSRRTPQYLWNGAAAGHRFVRTLVDAWSSGSAGWAFAPVRVAPAARYTYSVWTRSNATVLVQAQLRSSNGTASYLTLGEVSPTDAWQQSTFMFTTPAGTGRLAVRHLLTSVGTMDVDSARLVAGVATASLPPGPASTPPATQPPSIPPTAQPSAGPAPTNPPTNPPTSPPNTQPGNRAGLVSVTLDDGLASQYDNAAPVLAADHIPATFYLISSLLNGGANLTITQAKALQAGGNELGSHTVTHRNLTTLSAPEVTAELANSKAFLESQFGPIRTLAYPYGATNDAVAAEAAHYYASARTTNGGLNPAGGLDPYRLRMRYVTAGTDAATVAGWLNQAAASGAWVILVYHGVDSSGNVYSTTPSMFAAQMDAVRASGLTALTVSAALARVG